MLSSIYDEISQTFRPVDNIFPDVHISRGRVMSAPKAWLIGVGIFLYFAITTAWLPSKVILGPLSTANRNVQDLVTMALWGFFLGFGMWALRAAQKRGLI